MTKFNGSDLASGSGYALNIAATTASPAPGSASIVVDHNTVLNPVSQRIGVNANIWEDAATRRPVRTPVRNGHLRLSPKFIRYPGGHKSDAVTFFIGMDGSTLSQPTPLPIRFGDSEDITSSTFWWAPINNTNGAWSHDLYNLPEFLADCQATAATPIINVALDSIYNPVAGGIASRNITKTQAITNAVEMVRWCNITHSYGVKYWSIANESWSNNTSYSRGYVDSGGTAHPETYAADAADMAAAMKAVDPTIKIGMNWNTQAGFQTIITTAGEANIDWLDAHRYPFFNQDYATYQATPNPNMVSEANRATLALQAVASSPAQARIQVLMTETGFTSQPNNLGSAIIHAHILGAQLSASNIAAAVVWSGRYRKTSPTSVGTSHDLYTDQNALTPSGMGVLLAEQLGTPTAAVVTATSSVTDVFAYATYDSIQGRIGVLLINRSNSPQTGTVATAGMTSAKLRLLSGTGPTDTAPTFSTSTPTITAGVSTVTLPANSAGLLIATK